LEIWESVVTDKQGFKGFVEWAEGSFFVDLLPFLLFWTHVIQVALGHSLLESSMDDGAAAAYKLASSFVTALLVFLSVYKNFQYVKVAADFNFLV